jgi:hypothetical protein
MDRVAVEKFMSASMIEKDRENASDFRTAALRHWQTAQPGLHFRGSDFRKTPDAPMWNDPSLQVRFVCLFGGIAAPAIFVTQFALNKVIAHFRDGHWQLASLESICVEFAQQSRHCFAGRICIGILASCADHSLSVDAFPIRPSVCPTELPHIWPAFPTTPD